MRYRATAVAVPNQEDLRGNFPVYPAQDFSEFAASGNAVACAVAPGPGYCPNIGCDSRCARLSFNSLAEGRAWGGPSRATREGSMKQKESRTSWHEPLQILFT